MKKLLASLLAIITVCFMAVGFTACEDLPGESGNEGENNEPVSYTVTAEEWDNALNDLAAFISEDGIKGNFTCNLAGGDEKEILMVDMYNKAIKHQKYNMITYLISGYVYFSIDGGLEWIKYEYTWDEYFGGLFRYSLVQYLNAKMMGICLFANAEYDANKKEYSLLMHNEETEMVDADVFFNIKFENKKIVKYQFSLDIWEGAGAVLYEFSDYGKTTVTIPQEVIDSAVSSN